MCGRFVSIFWLTDRLVHTHSSFRVCIVCDQGNNDEVKVFWFDPAGTPLAGRPPLMYKLQVRYSTTACRDKEPTLRQGEKKYLCGLLLLVLTVATA